MFLVPIPSLTGMRCASSTYPGVHPGTPRGARWRRLSCLAGCRITINNQEQSLNNHLRATVGVDGTVRAMTTKNPTYAPTGYLQLFSAEEFRFRWLEALSEVRDKWRHRGVDHLARALCDHMDVQGSCHPSLPMTICAKNWIVFGCSDGMFVSSAQSIDTRAHP